MSTRNRIVDILKSWDFVIAAVAAMLVALVLRWESIPFTVAQELFAIAITLQSILFAVFFAAVTVLVSAGDNAFIKWLQKDNTYSGMLWYYKWTLGALLFALVVSLVFYAAALPYDGKDCGLPYPAGWMMVFAFVTTYSLVATAIGVFDALRYADRRAQFVSYCEDANLQAPPEPDEDAS